MDRQNRGFLFCLFYIKALRKEVSDFLVGVAILFSSLLIMDTAVGQDRHVLVAGNSMLYFNDMPVTLNCMLNEVDENFKVVAVTHSGATISSLFHRYSFEVRDGIMRKSVRLDKLPHIAKRLGEQDYIPSKKTQKRIRRWHGLDSVTQSTIESYIDQYSFEYVVIQEHGSHVELPRHRECISIKWHNMIKYQSRKIHDKEPSMLFSEPMLRFPSEKDYERIADKPKAGFSLTDRNGILEYRDIDDCSEYTVPVEGYKGKFTMPDTTPKYRSNEQILNYSYQCMSDFQSKVGGQVAYVGQLVSRMQQKYPKLKFRGKGGHPSKIGSYLMACYYYHLITGNSPTRISYLGNIKREDAELVRREIEAYCKGKQE